MRQATTRSKIRPTSGKAIVAGLSRRSASVEVSVSGLITPTGDASKGCCGRNGGARGHSNGDAAGGRVGGLRQATEIGRGENVGI